MRSSIITDRPGTPSRPASVWAQVRFRGRRLNRRRLVAIAISLVAALVVRQAMSRASAIEAGLGVTQPVVVALGDIEAGTIVEADHVQLQAWPAGLVPTQAIDDTALVLGLTVRSAITAGEPVVAPRVQSGNLGLDASEVGVTLPQPLARPPLELGQIVQLVGVRGVQDQFLAAASTLGTGRVVSFTDDELTVAVNPAQMSGILEHAAVGTVEVVITPRRG